MQDIETVIKNNIAETIAKRRIELVDIELAGSNKNPVIKIFVDQEGGISIDTCTVLSREIEQILESNNLIEPTYRLEVSSPGIDRPLKIARDYLRNIGRVVKIEYENNQLPSIEGEIISATNDDIHLKRNNNIENIPITAIKYGIIQIKW